MTTDLPIARAVLMSMVTMTAREAAELHGVTSSWAEKLVHDPPIMVRDAPWYRAAVKAVREGRAMRRTTTLIVVSRGRRV